jgi:hypothetical protein
MEIGSLDSLRVVLVASEREVADLAPGAVAEVRLRADPGRAMTCRLEQVDWAPADAAVLAEPVAALVDPERAPARFFARAAFAPGASAGLRPGMTGIARVGAKPLSVLQRIGRAYARLVRADFWL